MTPTQRGFTLVEILVALTIFSILSLAGVALLNQTLVSKTQVETSVSTVRNIQLTHTLLKADLAQIVPRPVRDSFGLREPAVFAGGMAYGSVPVLDFVRDGWENPFGQERRSSLQRVQYFIEDGALIRRAHLRLNGASPRDVQDRVLVRDVQEFDITFFTNGQWQPSWVVPQTGRILLPEAVAIEFETTELGFVRQVFLTLGAEAS